MPTNLEHNSRDSETFKFSKIHFIILKVVNSLLAKAPMYLKIKIINNNSNGINLQAEDLGDFVKPYLIKFIYIDTKIKIL